MYVHLNTDILELRVCGRVMVVCCVMCGNVRRGPKKHTSFTDTVQYTTLRAAVYNTAAHRGTPQRRTAVHNTAHRGTQHCAEKKRWPAKKNKKNGMFLAMKKKQEKRI